MGTTMDRAQDLICLPNINYGCLTDTSGCVINGKIIQMPATWIELTQMLNDPQLRQLIMSNPDNLNLLFNSAVGPLEGDLAGDIAAAAAALELL